MKTPLAALDDIDPRKIFLVQLAEMVLRLDHLGYRGDCSFEVFNDDDQQMPMPLVAARAYRSVPLPGRMRLKATT